MHNLADDVSGLRRSTKSEEKATDEVPCVVTSCSESTSRRDAAHAEHREAQISFSCKAKRESGTQHTTHSIVVCVASEPVARDPFIVQESLRTQKEDKLCRDCRVQISDPSSCFICDR